jgi:hypothetical protein
MRFKFEVSKARFRANSPPILVILLGRLAAESILRLNGIDAVKLDALLNPLGLLVGSLIFLFCFDFTEEE